MPASITEVSGTSKASAAAMAFGFGDITLPALPPPTIAKSIAVLEMQARWAIAKAMGETVITATSTNTPTEVKMRVARASASSARVSPTFLTIVSAIEVAAPDSISTPANTPAARIRSTAVTIP